MLRELIENYACIWQVGPLISQTISKDEFSEVLGFFLGGLTQAGQSHQLRYKASLWHDSNIHTALLLCTLSLIIGYSSMKGYLHRLCCCFRSPKKCYLSLKNMMFLWLRPTMSPAGWIWKFLIFLPTVLLSYVICVWNSFVSKEVLIEMVAKAIPLAVTCGELYLVIVLMVSLQCVSSV